MFSRNSPAVIRVGSRESALALAQTELFIRQIDGSGYSGAACISSAADSTATSAASWGAEFIICPIKTSGDMIQDRSLEEIGGKGLFIRELDRALLEGTIDMAIHSLKDMPMEVTQGLKLACFSDREDPRDVLVLPIGAETADRAKRAKRAKPVGCSSKRRSLQWAEISPEWSTAPIRGNVLTRLEKLDRGEYGALILAASGLKRLDLATRISRFFEPQEMLPAAGQGIMVAVTREDDDFEFLRAANSEDSAYCALAERAFVRALGGDCSSPIGAFAEIQGNTLVLRGWYHGTEGHWYYGTENQGARRGSITGDKTQAELLGLKLAEEIGP